MPVSPSKAHAGAAPANSWFGPPDGVDSTLIQEAFGGRGWGGMGSALPGRLLMLDGHSMEWTPVRLPRQAHCPVCAIR